MLTLFAALRFAGVSFFLLARAGHDEERERSHCKSLHYGSVLVAGAAGAAGAVVVDVVVAAGAVVVAAGAVVVAAGAGSAGWLMPMRVS